MGTLTVVFEGLPLMLLAQYVDCSTAGLKSLDLQLIEQINKLAPNTLVRFDDIPNLICGPAVHPYLQPGAKEALRKAIAARGTVMRVNSAYRTLAQQCVLYNHAQARRCSIKAAAKPGASNHNGGLALDIEDAPGWKPYLQRYGWRWIGAFDPMHFDFVGGGKDFVGGGKDIRRLSIQAFQALHNQNSSSKLKEDGTWGSKTYEALKAAPVEGYPNGNAPGSAVDSPEARSVLREGDKGSDVKELQSLLVKAGFSVSVDGDFGSGTEVAVKEFQSKNDLVADGIVGVATWGELLDT